MSIPADDFEPGMDLMCLQDGAIYKVVAVSLPFIIFERLHVGRVRVDARICKFVKPNADYLAQAAII